MSDPSKIRHLLLVPIPAYGHTRPLCALAGRLAAQGAVVTMLVAPNWLQKAQSDVVAQFPKGHEALERIRIVSLFDSAETQLFALIPKAIAHYPAAYETLLAGKAIKCASTGTTFPAVAPPSAVILDIFAVPQLQATRSVSGTTIPVFAFISAHGGALIRMFCPEEMGGRGDFGARIDAEARRVGKTSEEVGDGIYKHTEGAVLRIPGIPAMYDYEHYPQVPIDGPVAVINRAAYDMIMACDGIFAGTTLIYDGESLLAFEGWTRETLHKPVYAVGPLLPPGYGSEQTPPSLTNKDLEIKSFFDSMKSKHGDGSVLFISFGTLFWPKLAEQLEELVDALLETQFPFFLCHAAPSATVPDALSERIKASGIGMTSPWAPQQFILTHPATGWFLTHCGQGGTFEALASGVPMICWPFEGDQPVAAMHLSQNLNVAFHLMEVRTAKGLQPLHSGYVPKGTRAALRDEFRRTFDECRGEVGEEKRKNARRMQSELGSAWAEGGSSARALTAFLTNY